LFYTHKKKKKKNMEPPPPELSSKEFLRIKQEEEVAQEKNMKIIKELEELIHKDKKQRHLKRPNRNWQKNSSSYHDGL